MCRSTRTTLVTITHPPGSREAARQQPLKHRRSGRWRAHDDVRDHRQKEVEGPPDVPPGASSSSSASSRENKNCVHVQDMCFLFVCACFIFVFSFSPEAAVKPPQGTSHGHRALCYEWDKPEYKATPKPWILDVQMLLAVAAVFLRLFDLAVVY